MIEKTKQKSNKIHIIFQLTLQLVPGEEAVVGIQVSPDVPLTAGLEKISSKQCTKACD